MSFQKMYGLRGPSGLNMVNQAFIIVIAYRPRRRRRRRRKIPGIGRYPMGPTMINPVHQTARECNYAVYEGWLILQPLVYNHEA